MCNPEALCTFALKRDGKYCVRRAKTLPRRKNVTDSSIGELGKSRGILCTRNHAHRCTQLRGEGKSNRDDSCETRSSDCAITFDERLAFFWSFERLLTLQRCTHGFAAVITANFRYKDIKTPFVISRQSVVNVHHVRLFLSDSNHGISI